MGGRHTLQICMRRARAGDGHTLAANGHQATQQAMLCATPGDKRMWPALHIARRAMQQQSMQQRTRMEVVDAGQDPHVRLLRPLLLCLLRLLRLLLHLLQQQLQPIQHVAAALVREPRNLPVGHPWLILLDTRAMPARAAPPACAAGATGQPPKQVGKVEWGGATGGCNAASSTSSTCRCTGRCASAAWCHAAAGSHGAHGCCNLLLDLLQLLLPARRIVGATQVKWTQHMCLRTWGGVGWSWGGGGGGGTRISIQAWVQGSESLGVAG